MFMEIVAFTLFLYLVYMVCIRFIWFVFDLYGLFKVYMVCIWFIWFVFCLYGLY